VFAAVIDALQPHAQLSVELFQATRGIFGKGQRDFKILLECSENPFDLPLAPSVIWPGVA
jgi:hypothetical protein